MFFIHYSTGDFNQAVGSLLSVKADGILSWIGDDNFLMEDKKASIHEVLYSTCSIIYSKLLLFRIVQIQGMKSFTCEQCFLVFFYDLYNSYLITPKNCSTFSICTCALHFYYDIVNVGLTCLL